MTTITVRRINDQIRKTIIVPKFDSVNNLVIKACAALGITASAAQADLYHNCKKLGRSQTIQAEIGHNWDSEVCLVVRPNSRAVCSQTSKQDMINAWDSSPRVLMPCGHAITPINLYDYCWSQLEQKKTELKCPAVNNKYARCDCVWGFKTVSESAALSSDEQTLFEWVLNKNWFDKVKNIQLCPKCGEAIGRDCLSSNQMVCNYCQVKFCYYCRQQWLIPSKKDTCGNSLCSNDKSMTTCARKTIIGVPGCPSVRACPNCQFTIEHQGDGTCKHMDCPSCGVAFCFICLQMKTDSLYWPDSCGGAFITCVPAAIQSL